MASRYTPQAYHAIGVLDERFVPDEADGSSSYSESTPRPGVGAPSTTATYASVRASGAQSVSLTVTTARAGTWRGMPSGARVTWRPTASATTAERGWLTPAALTGTWRPNADDYDWVDLATVPTTQLLMMFANNQDNAEIECWRIDPAGAGPIDTITVAQNIAPTAYVSGCVLPVSERIIIVSVDSADGQADAYFSDDSGATWGVYGTDILDIPISATSLTSVQVRVSPLGTMILHIGYDDGAAKAIQYVSTDYGASFQRVAAGWAATSTSIAILVDGSVGLTTVSGADVQWRRVASVRDRLDLATPATIAAGVTRSSVSVDADGSVYVLGYDGSDGWRLFRLDEPAGSWVVYDHYAIASAATRTPDGTAWAAGCLWCGTGTTAGGTAGTTPLMLFRWGGWGGVDTDRTGVATDSGDPWATAKAWSGSVSATVGDGWTYAGVLAANADGWSTGAPPAAGYVYRTPPDDDSRYILAFADFAVTSGGSTAADQAGVIIRVRNSAASDTRGLAIRADTAGFVLYDIGAAAIELTVAIDMTTRVQFVAQISTTTYRFGYRALGAAEWTWSGGSLTAVAGSPAAVVGWGDNGVAVSDFYAMSYFAGDGSSGPGIAYAGGSLALHGRPISSIPYPLYRVGTAATSAAVHLVGGDGPTGYADGWVIAPAADYPLAAVDPRLSPSPDVVWRSTDTSEQTIAWIPTASTRWTSSSVALVILRANFATAYLEYWDGAAWQTAGTWSSVIGSSLTAAVSGDWVTPNGGTIARYIQRGELVGGTVNRNGTLKRIVANTEGVWGADATTRRLEVQTDGTVTAGSTTSIQAPDGVLVVHGLTTSRARWRVRIPSQSTAEGYLEAGHIGLYAVAVPGAAFAWGWTDESRQNVSEARDRYGTAYRRDEGPLQRIFAMAWTDGQAQGPLRTEGAAAAVSYISVDGTNAVGVRRDVPWLLRGMLEEARAGALPVVGLANLTAGVSSQMIVDPSVWVVGYWTGSVATAHVSGILGDSEVVRVETVSIEALT
jgi:hypothetical protein